MQPAKSGVHPIYIRQHCLIPPLRPMAATYVLAPICDRSSRPSPAAISLRTPPTLQKAVGAFLIISSGFSTPCQSAFPSVFKHGIDYYNKKSSLTFDGLSLP